MTKYGLTTIVHQGLTGLLLLLLFAAPMLMRCISGGEGYLVAATGLVAFASLLLPVTNAGGHADRPATAALRLTAVDVAFLLCLGYMSLNLHRPIDTGLCAELLTITGLWGALRRPAAHRFRRWVAVGMVLSAVVQAFVALLQYAGALPSLHPDFAATGTFGNPGPLGGYLAMGLATLWPRVASGSGLNKWQRSALAASALLLVVGLAVADSRAAWLAAALALSVYYLRNPMGRKRVAWPLLCGMAVLAVSATLALHSYRPASADARLRVWDVCWRMVAEAPWTGQGTGGFATAYMPAQTAAIATAPEERRRAADDVTAAFNDTLGTLCEQGILGLLLAGGFIVTAGRSLWRHFRTDARVTSFFPFLTLLVFAQFSYPLSVWSLCAPFFALTAAGLADGRRVTIPYGRIVVSCLSAVAVLLLASGLALRVDAFRQLSRYCRMETAQFPAAGCPATAWLVRHDPVLLAASAKAQQMTENGPAAILTLRRLLEYTDETHLHIALGDAYAETGRYGAADSCYAKARAMRPGLVTPAFARFQLWKDEDPLRARRLATAVADMRPQKENSKARAMKAEAKRYLDRSPAP